MEKERTMEVVNELLQYLKLNPRQLNSILGYANPNWLYGVLSPQGAGLSRNKAQKIVEKFPQISLTYLLSGEGSLLNTDKAENIQQNINSSHITQTGNVEAPTAQMDKLISVLAEQSQQVTKAQEQIDRLITIIEKQSNH